MSIILTVGIRYGSRAARDLYFISSIKIIFRSQLGIEGFFEVGLHSHLRT